MSLDAFDTFYKGSAGTSHTLTGFTVANNDNRLLLVFVGTSAGAAARTSAVTFNGDALTQLVDIGPDATFFSANSLWYLLQPDVASGDVVVTTLDSVHVIMSVISLYCIDQAVTFRDSDSENGDGTDSRTGNLTLTTLWGDFVVSGIHVRGNGINPGALIPDAGTETEEVAAQTIYRGSSSYRTAVGATTVVGWDWTDASAAFSHIGVTVIPYLDTLMAQAVM